MKINEIYMYVESFNYKNKYLYLKLKKKRRIELHDFVCTLNSGDCR